MSLKSKYLRCKKSQYWVDYYPVLKVSIVESREDCHHREVFCTNKLQTNNIVFQKTISQFCWKLKVCLGDRHFLLSFFMAIRAINHCVWRVTTISAVQQSKNNEVDVLLVVFLAFSWFLCVLLPICPSWEINPRTSVRRAGS